MRTSGLKPYMIIDIIQIISAVLLVIAILMQNRGSGLGAAFGGGGDVYHAKRGMEKTLFNITIALAIIFFITALANVLF
ncbi:MAG: preprotein translocase subunit SecG [Patescibacteria group bacterium]